MSASRARTSTGQWARPATPPCSAHSARTRGLTSAASPFLHWNAGVQGGYATRSYSRGSEVGVVSIWGPAQNAWAAFAGLDIALAVFAALTVVAGLIAWRARTWIFARITIMATSLVG